MVQELTAENFKEQTMDTLEESTFNAQFPSGAPQKLESLITKELREKACYNIHESFEKKLTEQIKAEAVDFVNKIKLLLK